MYISYSVQLDIDTIRLWRGLPIIIIVTFYPYTYDTIILTEDNKELIVYNRPFILGIPLNKCFLHTLGILDCKKLTQLILDELANRDELNVVKIDEEELGCEVQRMNEVIEKQNGYFRFVI